MAATKTHVIELITPAITRRPLYLKRINRDGGFLATTNKRKARRFEPTDAARALQSMQRAIEASGITPAVVLA